MLCYFYQFFFNHRVQDLKYIAQVPFFLFSTQVYKEITPFFVCLKVAFFGGKIIHILENSRKLQIFQIGNSSLFIFREFWLFCCTLCCRSSCCCCWRWWCCWYCWSWMVLMVANQAPKHIASPSHNNSKCGGVIHGFSRKKIPKIKNPRVD